MLELTLVRVLAGVGATVLCAAVAGCGVASGSSGVSVRTPAGETAPELSRDDVAALDQYAALGPGSVATVGDSIGVAVGVGTECAMVRVGSAGVEVWAPERVSLQPGEVGCEPSGQLALREH